MASQPVVAAIVTAYRPDDQLFARFAPLLARCSHVFVVDNTPSGHLFGPAPSGFVVHQDGVNKGLGPALNTGIEHARRSGADAAILFDQDSTPALDLIQQLIAAWIDVSRRGACCCIGPAYVDDSRIGAADEGQGREGLTEVTCLPTSGMVVPIAALSSSDGFAAELFLDFVDFEWCWRLGRRGWRFYRAPAIRMFHRLGLEQRHWMGLTFHVPSPYRHYFQVRDALRLANRWQHGHGEIVREGRVEGRRLGREE